VPLSVAGGGDDGFILHRSTERLVSFLEILVDEFYITIAHQR